MTGWVVAFGLGLAFVGALAVGQSWGPVSRARVGRFASRHRLPITPGNGEPVIRYLALTRRWRAGGLVAGAAVSLAASIPRGTARADFLALLAGWFAGALVAEVRLAATAGALREPGRRVASLHPRSSRAYLGWPQRLVLPVAVLLSTGTAAATLVAARGVQLRYLTVWLVGLVVAGSVTAVARRVLRRRQPVLPADRLAADEAIRSRSLHVLYAAGATLVLYCELFQLERLRPLLAPDSTGYAVVRLAAAVGVVAVPLLGWLLATARWTVRAPSQVPVAA